MQVVYEKLAIYVWRKSPKLRQRQIVQKTFDALFGER